MCGQDKKRTTKTHKTHIRTAERNKKEKRKQVSGDRPTLQCQPSIFFLSETEKIRSSCSLLSVEPRKFVVVQSYSFRIHTTSLSRLRQNRVKECEQTD